jgi:hypothetical protein
MEKVFATWEKLFTTWKKCSQHDVWILIATCSPQARNMFATNSQHRSQHVYYVREGERGAQHEKVFATWEKVFTTWKKCSQHEERCSQHGKSFRNMGKGVRYIRNTLRNIMIRRLICFLIRIVWLKRCPMLAPESDVRALAVPISKTFSSTF